VTAPVENRPNFALLIYHDVITKQSPPGRFLQASDIFDGYMEMSREESLNYILNVLDECERKELERKERKRKERPTVNPASSKTTSAGNSNSHSNTSTSNSNGDIVTEGNKKRKRHSISGNSSASGNGQERGKGIGSVAVGSVSSPLKSSTATKTLQISPIVENDNGNRIGNGNGKSEANGSMGAITDATNTAASSADMVSVSSPAFKKRGNHSKYLRQLSPDGNTENDQLNKNSVSDDNDNDMDMDNTSGQDPLFRYTGSVTCTSAASASQSTSHPQFQSQSQSQSHAPQHLTEHQEHIGNPHMFCDKCIGTGLLPVPSHLLLFLNADANPNAETNANACADNIIEEKDGDGIEWCASDQKKKTANSRKWY